MIWQEGIESNKSKRTGVSSWKHLIDVHLNFTFEYDKKVVEGRVFLITSVIWQEQKCNIKFKLFLAIFEQDDPDEIKYSILFFCHEFP